MKITQAEKLVSWCLVRGAVEVPARTRKYRAFARADRPGEFYFIGRCGALRAGRTVADSISLTDMVRP